MSGAALARLKEFGYAFNKEGQLRKIDEKTGEVGDEPFQFDVFDGDQNRNQEHYEKIAELIPEIVYDLLQKCGMTRIYIPFNNPKDESTFIFTHPNQLRSNKKLLVLIHGSGYVRAGQWARSLIINNSLDHGTQIPYIKQAQENGYQIVVTNTNDNYRLIDGRQKAIPGLGTPNEHAAYVWKNIIMASNPQAVAIIAHSYGGAITMELAEEFPDFFEKYVFSIAFTDSVYCRLPKNASVLKHITCNWVASSEPLDKEMKPGSNGLKQVSAGHSKHEWTSWAAQKSVFKFMEENYQNFIAHK